MPPWASILSNKFFMIDLVESFVALYVESLRPEAEPEVRSRYCFALPFVRAKPSRLAFCSLVGFVFMVRPKADLDRPTKEARFLTFSERSGEKFFLSPDSHY